MYILLGVFLGAFGVHNFVAGHTQNGVIQLCVTLGCYLGVFCTFGLSALGVLAMQIWAIVEICTVTADADGRRMY